jgi:tetratricopeptide (TPR) repeat protein
MPKKIKKRQSSMKKKQADNIIPLPRREAMEGAMADIFGGGKGRAVDEAQDIMYDAWEATTTERAIALAKKALEVSPDCADAYVLLAQETAKSLAEEIDLYRKGVEAGERALGKEAFMEDVGHFWGILETRPYMRARAGLAECLWEAGQREEAVDHYHEMLRLNPNDNQGLRYLLMPRLIELDLDEKAEGLFAQYSDDGSAFWMYSRALLDFRKQGDSQAANKSLKNALKANKYVPEYLLGRRRMLRSLPPHYSFGSEDEAVIYVDDNKGAWKATPGALEWLSG